MSNILRCDLISMGHTSEFRNFLDIHKNQLLAANIPEIFWFAIFHKLQNVIFDAGYFFRILKVEEFKANEPRRILQCVKNLSSLNSQSVFIIDHAWTFTSNTVKNDLQKCTALLERLCHIFGMEEETSTNKIQEIMSQLWNYANWYSIKGAEERLPSWYVMDEVGSAVWHSDSPNCRIVPFVYAKDPIAYSILFPIQDINEGDFILRDFAEGISDMNRKVAYLIPWQPTSMEHINQTPSIPGADYFLAYHMKETLPKLSNFVNKRMPSNILKVYSQYELINIHLTSNKFVIVKNEDAADILWYMDHFRDFEELSKTPLKYINQFPYEYVITLKDLLNIICRRKESENWMPTTYNLLTELPNFVSHFQYREQQGLDNIWILKPYNLARGLDTHISNNLNHIIRLSVTGPKICQKYITNPVLFYRSDCNGKVKFDIRYVLLLKSTKPLEAYVYRKFFVRFANQPFDLNDFNLYEKHFTVMNYTENAILKHMKCEEFIIEFKEQYPSHCWDNMELLILKMLRDILESSTSLEPPCGIAESPQSRALYAADIMLEWNKDYHMVPRILEINFMPDCNRACAYYPNFYNEIFQLLFLNDGGETCLPI